MKNLKSTVIALLTSMVAPVVSHSQVLNGGFENWDSVPFTENGKNFIPNGWYEINNENCFMDGVEMAVTRTADAHSGNFAIQLKNVQATFPINAMLMSNSATFPDVNNKIPVSGKPNKLDLYYKFSSPSNDTFFINVLLTKGNEFIGAGLVSSSVNKDTYTKLSVPILYQIGSNNLPDSAIIVVELGKYDYFVEGSKLIIDDVAFGYSTGLNNNDEDFKAQVNIWPNPTSSMLNVSVAGAKGEVLVELVDMLGKTIETNKLSNALIKDGLTFNLSGLNKGFYFVKVSDTTGSKAYKVLHQ